MFCSYNFRRRELTIDIFSPTADRFLSHRSDNYCAFLKYCYFFIVNFFNSSAIYYILDIGTYAAGGYWIGWCVVTGGGWWVCWLGAAWWILFFFIACGILLLIFSASFPPILSYKWGDYFYFYVSLLLLFLLFVLVVWDTW